jgi:fimbrial chaperone protein
MSRLPSLVLALLTLTLASVAHGSSLVVSPVRVYLDAGRTSETLVLTNTGPEAINVQVSAYAWRETKYGQPDLAPTRDVVFYPSIVSLNAGEARKIRVAVTRKVAAVELTYRIFVEELPPPQKVAGGIRVLARFGIPIFLRPRDPQAQPAATLRMVSDHVELALANRGNSHFIASSVRVRGRSAEGVPVFEQDLVGWYVLARSERVYEIALPRLLCEQLDSLEAVVVSDGLTFESQSKVARASCAD